jgi:acetyl esterase/lipase
MAYGTATSAEAARAAVLLVVAVAVLAPGAAAPAAEPSQVDEGQPHARCTPHYHPTRVPPAGALPNALGVSPAYHEVQPPLTRATRGVMISVHGGGWFAVGAGLLTSAEDLRLWRRLGWMVVNVDYRPCARSLDDVLWYYDRVRGRWPRLPVCAEGASAGGHLVLMLAALRPALDCALAYGAPTDFTRLRSQAAYCSSWSVTAGCPEGPRAQILGPRWVHDLARAAFGEHRLAELSPARRRFRARLLVASAARDQLIPTSQTLGFRQRVLERQPKLQVRALILGHGDRPWVHASISSDARDRLHRTQRALVGSIEQRRWGRAASPGI